MVLWPEDLNELSSDVANRTRREIGAAFQATNLMSTRRHHAINRVVITNDTLKINSARLESRLSHIKRTKLQKSLPSQHFAC